MYDRFDSLVIGLIIIGTAFGFLKGPFALLLPMLGAFVAYPFLNWLKPMIINLFTDEGLKAVVYLVYYPLSYFTLLSLLGFSGKKLDRFISRLLSPWVRYFLGALLGFLLSVMAISTVLFYILPFIKNSTIGDYRKSRVLVQLETFLQQHPTLSQQLPKLELFALPNHTNKQSEQNLSNIEPKNEKQTTIEQAQMELENLLQQYQTQD